MSLKNCNRNLVNASKYPTAGGGTPPVNTVAPVVTFTDWDTDMTVTTGTWTGDAPITYTYQWKRDGVNIAGETANTYTPSRLLDIGPVIKCTVTATNAAGAASQDSNNIEAWTPAELSMALWTESSDNSAPNIVSSGGQVSNWDDKTANANDIYQATGSDQPITGTRTLGGMNAIDWDGVNHFMNLTSGIDILNKMLFVVCQTDDYGTAEQNGVISDTAGIIEIQIDDSPAGALGSNWRSGDERFATAKSTVLIVPVSTPSLVGWSFVEGDFQYFHLDGDIETGGIDNGLGPTEMNIIGGRGIASDEFNGLIAEIMITNSILSASDLEKLEGYANHKWQTTTLKVGHTYRTVPPMKQS